MLPATGFGHAPLFTGWLDAEESQRLLQYQRRGLDDYIREALARLGIRSHLIRCFRPIVRGWVLGKSPYLPRSRWLVAPH